MTTPARIKANRRNALKSTGPRSAHGKAIVGRNALRHGFRSHYALLPGENPDDYLDLLHQLRSEFPPSSPTEDILVEQMAVSYWKLSRLQRIETQVYGIRSEDDSLMDALREVFSPDAAPDSNSSRVLSSLANYEACLERSFFRALRELTKRTHSSP